MASNTENLYVTLVDIDRDLLKVWGQRNRMAATYIERQLTQLIPELNVIPSPDKSRIRKGMFCFAKYRDDNYYRARVISDVLVDSVRVLFVDYGNKDYVQISNIRVEDGSNGEILATIAEQADEYYLGKVAAPQGGWTNEIISEIRRYICYEVFACEVIAKAGDQKILDIQFRNENFSDFLVQRQIARPVSLTIQSQLILSYCSLTNEAKMNNSFREAARVNTSVPHPPGISGRVLSQVEMQPQYKFSSPSHGQFSPSRQYSSPRQMHNANKPSPPDSYYASVNHLNHPSVTNENLVQSMNPSFNPMFDPLQQMKGSQPPPLINSFNNVVIEALAQQIKQYIAEDNAKAGASEEEIPHNYVNSVLEVGSSHNVFISSIDDGPWSFSIQLVNCAAELNKLMEELAKLELTPIKPPIILGHPCIGASALYNNLCRGVVVSISHSSVKVYFVDFGNTEDLLVSSIFELPPEFFKTRVLSQKFSLSGLQKVAYSDDIKKFFKEVVQDELLLLRVTSPEGDNLPNCELYLKDINIKRILNEKIRESRNSAPQEEPLKAGDTESVVVTWVEGPQKFFVQLHKKDPELSALKKELNEVGKRGKPLRLQELNVGFRCVGLYESDGQWYRVAITSIESENAITVSYVDYGNTETVGISLLRRIEGPSLINQMSVQAFQCCLNGFENEPYDLDKANKLEALIFEKDLNMTVVSADKDRYSVVLYENRNNIASLLRASLQPKIESNEYKVQDNENDWNKSPPLIDSSPTSSNVFEKKKRFSENTESPEKKDNWSARGDKQSFENKGNRWDDKPRTDERSFNSNDNFGANKGFKQDKENNWRERKAASGGDKFGGSRGSGFKQDVGDGWNERKSSSSNDKHSGSSGFRGRDNSGWNDRGGDRKKFDGGKAGKPRFGEKEVDWKDRSDTFAGGDFDRKKKFQNDRHEKPFHGNEKKDYGNDKRDKKFEEPRRQPIKNEDLPPPGSKFDDRTVEIGNTEKAIITFYLNPHEFYVQVLTHEEDFKKMMHDIQWYYSNKYSLRNEAKVGDIVVSQFSVDKILYRGEITRATPVMVRYVDYGNQEVVGPKRTWAVAKQFLNLPKQAVKCRLSNIQPAGSEWPPPGSPIDKFFEFEEYKCTFLGVENDVYEIKLEAIENGKDIASELISAGLGVPTSPQISVEEIDYSLLPGQVLKLYISHVENSSKFFVIINPKCVEKIDEEVKAYTKNKENLLTLDDSSLKPEMPCLCSSDDVSWHIGTIVSLADDNVTVWLNNRGDSLELTKDKIKSIPHYLKDFQPQAVECCLSEASDSDLKGFKDEVEHKHFLVSIKSATDKRLSVVLYDQDGRRLYPPKRMETPESIEPISHHPITAQKIPLLITHVESPKEVYVQKAGNRDEEESLRRDLADFYDKHNTQVKNENWENVLVAAKSNTHNCWRRGRVIASSENELQVFYIDFGDKESLSFENVKKLDPSFCKLSALAKKVALDVEYDTEMTKVINNKILEFAQGKELIGHFVNNDGEFVCEFTINGNRITSMLGSIGSISPKEDRFKEVLPATALSTTAEQPSKAPLESVSDGLKVIVSHIDNPKRFWVHKESSMNDLQQFQDKLQESCETQSNKESVKLGEVVAAVFCDSWYRAKVIKVDGNNITVQFIDYGNDLDVDLGCDTVKELPSDLVKVPIFATCYSLKGNWSDKATAKFEEIIMQYEEPVSAVVLEEGDPVIVDLLKDGHSIVEKLIEEGVAVADQPEDHVSVYITHCDSPDDFYIQKETCTESLDVITNRLFDADTFEDVSSVLENEIYVGKFQEDDAWYRVRVLKKHSDETEVLFIDYGNTSFVTDFKCLPTDLVNIPPLAENCCLVYGKTCDGWSEAACEKFREEYMDERQLKMKVIVDRVKKPIVELYSDGGSVSEELAALCEPDGRLDVYISQVNSPSDFYVQYVDDDDFKTIALTLENGNDLEDLQGDVKPGALCGACFIDDGLWYRARILQKLDEGFEVFFMDYGNVSVSTELKKLPEEIEKIPPRALRCSLNLPEKNIPESVKEEFINLTSDCETVFRARIITPGDTNIVSLKLNGRILEQTLSLESIPEDDVSTRFGDAPTHRDDETDDDKNSKMNAMTDTYLSSNLEDDVRAASSIRNETDEEKRVKIAISVADGGGPEGFKSDDEKGIAEAMALSGIVNATDNELMEESMEDEETANVEEYEDAVEDGDLANGGGAEIKEETTLETVEEEEEDKTETGGNDLDGNNTSSEAGERAQKTDRNKVHKIVPGSISRGEPEKDSSETPETPTGKLSHSEKLVPGSISRGVSLEIMPNGSEEEEEGTSMERQISQSAPNTPKPNRRTDAVAYTRIDQNDRLVPGCISTGMHLACEPSTEKTNPVEKIVPGSVNGSFVED